MFISSLTCVLNRYSKYQILSLINTLSTRNGADASPLSTVFYPNCCVCRYPLRHIGTSLVHKRILVLYICVIEECTYRIAYPHLILPSLPSLESMLHTHTQHTLHTHHTTHTLSQVTYIVSRTNCSNSIDNRTKSYKLRPRWAGSLPSMGLNCFPGQRRLIVSASSHTLHSIPLTLYCSMSSILYTCCMGSFIVLL